MALTRSFRFVLYGLAVFIIIASMIAVAQRQGNGPSGSIPEVTAADHMVGPDNAKLTLVTYSDFQCPACLAVEPTLKKILELHPNDVRLVYRHFPLHSLHPNAAEAAWASEAASIQGKFWEMHDMLFDRQNDWANLAEPSAMFSAYAELLSLNKEQFMTDYQSNMVRDRVKVDEDSGNAANITGTPTFYINGEVIENPRNHQAFLDLIQQKLDEINASEQTPTPASE